MNDESQPRERSSSPSSDYQTFVMACLGLSLPAGIWLLLIASA
jgi:hypothetical protein